jgi:hypothetical protein
MGGCTLHGVFVLAILTHRFYIGQHRCDGWRSPLPRRGRNHTCHLRYCGAVSYSVRPRVSHKLNYMAFSNSPCVSGPASLFWGSSLPHLKVQRFSMITIGKQHFRRSVHPPAYVYQLTSRNLCRYVADTAIY